MVSDAIADNVKSVLASVANIQGGLSVLSGVANLGGELPVIPA